MPKCVRSPGLGYHGCHNLSPDQTLSPRKQCQLYELCQTIRNGEYNEACEKLLEQCSRVEPDSKTKCLRLCPKLDTAEAGNARQFALLPGPSRKFIAVDQCSAGQQHPCYKALDHCLAQKEQEWKKGSRVMQLANINPSEGMCHGAIGTIVQVPSPPARWVRVLWNNPTLGSRVVFPFLFKVRDGVVAHPETVTATREQLPLVHCWWLSIHKAQGAKCDRLHIDFKGTWECGMVYTALTRCTSLAGLSFVNFSPDMIQADHKAKEWYRNAERAWDMVRPGRAVFLVYIHLHVIYNVLFYIFFG